MDTNKKMNILQLLGTEFESKEGPIVLQEITKTPLIGIFFSAEWCPPCQGFFPILMNFYKEVNKTKKVFEIIFCSSDQDDESYVEHYKSMPWLTFPYDCDAQNELYETFDIVGVPVVVIMNSKGDVLDTKGRNTIQKQGANSIEFWTEANKQYA